MSAGSGAASPDRPVDRISRVITDLIAIDSIKWADFIDAVSLVEVELKTDPAGVYPEMTFETRKRYRRVVETLAERCDSSESEIARQVVALCRDTDAQGRSAHVGYWLIEDGLQTLEAALRCRIPLRLAMQRRMSQYSGTIYAVGLILLAVAAMCVSVFYLWAHDATLGQWIVGLAISLLPATIPSVWFGHWIITRLSRPDVLPEMDFSKAIPQDCAIAVVIPVIVASREEARAILQKIEILYPGPPIRPFTLSFCPICPTPIPNAFRTTI